MPPIHPYFKNIRQLIGDGQMEEAIRQLKVLLANSPKLNEALLHSGRWNDVLQQIRKGTVTHEDANVTKNQIREALLQFIQEIENQQQEPTLRQELSNAISIAQSKNVSRGSIKAGGHVRIGDENHYHYYGKKKILHALTPDPFLPEAFLGRTKELSEIHRRLRTDHHFLLLVNGEGGVGKTSLAAKYYFQYHHEYQHVAWLLSEKSIANALLRLDRSLGIKFPPTMRSPEKLKILFTEMASLKAPCLLVLDNANEINDLDEHYLKLRGIHNFHILLTTRITRYSQADTYPIRGLPKDDALELFEKYYRPLSPEEYDLFTQIRTAVNDNTLVLEVLAKNLRQLNRLRDRYTLADLLGDLQKKNLLQLAQSKSVTATYQSRGALRREKPENIIAAMYDLTELPREEVALLSMFAVLPADAIPFEKLEMLLPEELELEDPLLSLSQRGWIEHNEDDATFKCSPVVQEVTRRKNEQLRKDCQPLIDGLNKKLDYEPGVGHFKNATYENALVFAGYAESVVNIDKADFDLAMLSERIGGCFRTTGNLEKALFFFEKEKKLFANLLEINPENSTFKNGLAVSYSKLGDTHSSLGHLEKALQYFEERSRLGKELYEKYPQNVGFKNGLAVSYERLGDMHSSLGHLEKALQYFEERSRLGKELYEKYPKNVGFKNGLAVSYERLGDTHSSLGHLEKALQYFEDETELFEELYEKHPQNVGFKNGLAVSYERLGDMHSSLGHLEKALQYFEERSRLGKELYEKYPQNVVFKNGLAISYFKLGEFYRDQKKDLTQAKKYFQQCCNLWKELTTGHPDYAEFQKNFDWVKNALEEL